MEGGSTGDTRGRGPQDAGSANNNPVLSTHTCNRHKSLGIYSGRALLHPLWPPLNFLFSSALLPTLPHAGEGTNLLSRPPSATADVHNQYALAFPSPPPPLTDIIRHSFVALSFSLNVLLYHTLTPRLDASVMRPLERLTVPCTLLLLYMLFSAPLGFLTVFWHRTTSAAVGVSSPSPLKRLSTDSAPGLSTNYASLYLGAAVVSMEPSSCHGGAALISDSVDKYVLCPCDAPRKQFVVQLIRDVQVRSVMVRNSEHFSSGVRNFTLLGSLQYPTSTWLVLGHFEAEQRRGRQYFDIAPRSRVRFIKLQWATSYGPEPWCTITSFQVYGIDVLETLTRYEGGDDLVAGEGAAGASGGLHSSPDMHPFHFPALLPTPGEGMEQSLGDRRAVLSRFGATSANGTPMPEVSLQEVSAGVWDGAAAIVGASTGVDADDLLAPVDVGVSAEADPLSQRDVAVKQPASTNPIEPVEKVPALQSVNCSSAQPINWSTPLKCTISNLAALWGPCAADTLGESALIAATTPTSVPASPVNTSSSKGFSASKSIYQSAAGSLLTNLLRQQRSTHHELTLLMQRERHLAQELNRTRILLSDFYAKYKTRERESNEDRNRLRALQLKVQLLQERFLLREQSSCCGERSGVGRPSGSIMQINTAMAVVGFVLFVLTVILALLCSSSSSRSAVGSPNSWERYCNIGCGGGGAALGGGNGRPLWPRQQRGRAR
ncbi:hypothetical protein, conserved [Leishmania tarentolae]|uniref:SUN domain-containing protein n=1 Tax=Leishmania tarentolae TaxID=5689 RepID=A0A640KLL8_LEITA|nr:hypothetical protein, conserved [Leishmania tarentolae]